MTADNPTYIIGTPDDPEMWHLRKAMAVKATIDLDWNYPNEKILKVAYT
jgi:hypothetical protein